MFKKIFFLIMLMLVFLTAPLFHINAANPLEINLNQTKYFPGDEIIMRTEFVNSFTQEIKGVLICSFISPNNEMPPMPTMVEIELKSRESEKLKCVMTVGETMPEGVYKAQAEVMDQNKKTIVKNEKEFVVTGTKKNIEAELSLCGDKECAERKIVFITGEKVYLKLKINIDNINIKADVNSQEIIFDNNLAIFEPKKTGSFAVNINLEKQGFIKKEINKNFAVISSPVKIESTSVCNINSKCENRETKQNCPQDCTVVRPETSNQRNIIFFILLIVAIGLILVGYVMMKKKDENNQI